MKTLTTSFAAWHLGVIYDVLRPVAKGKRPDLRYVDLVADGGEIVAHASDGFRLAKYRFPCSPCERVRVILEGASLPKISAKAARLPAELSADGLIYTDENGDRITRPAVDDVHLPDWSAVTNPCDAGYGEISDRTRLDPKFLADVGKAFAALDRWAGRAGEGQTRTWMHVARDRGPVRWASDDHEFRLAVYVMPMVSK